MDSICPSVIDSLVCIWAALHKDLNVEIEAAETCYLRSMIFEMDDDLVARLLAAKLVLSKPHDRARLSVDPARTGSEVLYSVQGKRCRVRLVHGSTVGDGFLGVGTRFGAALIGLRPGQSVLWPHEHGRLVEVQVLEVMTPLGRLRYHTEKGSKKVGVPCAFG